MIPVFVLTSDGAGMSDAIFDQLHPFQRALLVDGGVPEDTWTRMARHWHECYRLSHPPGPGGADAAARRPWSELDEFLRQDNILQLRSIMTAVVERGPALGPERRSVAPGSFIELSDGSWSRSPGPSTPAGTGGGWRRAGHRADRTTGTRAPARPGQQPCGAVVGAARP